MLSLSDEDQRLAAEVRDRANWLEVRRKTLSLGTETLAGLRDEAAAQTAALAVQQRQVDAARQALQKKQAQLAQLRDAREAQFVTNSLSASETQLMIAAKTKLLAGQDALVARLKVEANALDIAYRGRFEWPEHGNFIITQEFGPTPWETFHTGLDMAYLTPRCGGLIYAAGDGVVLEDGRPLAQWGDSAIGVVIGHSQRLATIYWHLSGEIVTVGQYVHAGDVIGYEGMTGWATGCHLHFGVMLDGVPQNPRFYLP
jgi:murein DD-endopeptidase MepM/ murein hydrolase activator NlpD